MPPTRPKILLAHYPELDVYTEGDLDAFDRVGQLLRRAPVWDWTAPGVDELLAETEVLVGHWGCAPIDSGVLDRAPNLGLLAYAAGTLKDVVTDAVWERNLRVTSGARANAEPVAEYALAAILFANKDVFWIRDSWREREARGKADRGAVPAGNYHKTIGIIGASLVGRRVIDLLRPFPTLSVLLYDPFVSAEQAAELGVVKADLDDLCTRCDILSVHAPALPATHHLIGAGQLAQLRTGATVINTSRGSLIDQDALTAEAAKGRLYFILDVTEPEPLARDHPLRTLPNVFLTPHIAGSSGTELHRLVDDAIEEISRWIAGESALNEVTRDQLTRLA